VVVQGAPIETLAWGRVGDPGLLLLHGNSAHADWYSFIAPLLRQGRRGYFLACSAFPKCRNIESVTEEEAQKIIDAKKA